MPSLVEHAHGSSGSLEHGVVNAGIAAYSISDARKFSLVMVDDSPPPVSDGPLLFDEADDVYDIPLARRLRSMKRGGCDSNVMVVKSLKKKKSSKMNQKK